MKPVEVQVCDDLFPAFEPLPGGDHDPLASLFAELTERTGRGELVLLTRPPSEFGLSDERRFPGHRWLVGALMRSIGDDCAVAVLDMLSGGARPVEWGLPPLLVSSRATIRYVASSAEDVPEPNAIIETPRLRKDFSEFTRLWAAESEPEPPDHFLHEQRKLFAIGHTLGRLHGDGVVWEDAHADQFIYSPDYPGNFHGWVVIDLDEHIGTLYRPPPPALSASDLLPILRELRPSQYPWFRHGYLEGRGPDGGRVFDLIESGDLTGWRAALRDERPDRARERLAAQIAADYDLSVDARLNALNQAGMAFSRAGLHADAATAYEAALTRRSDTTSDDYRVTRFNWSQARRRAGDLEAARCGLEEVLALEAASPLMPQLEHAASVTLQELREEGG
jgi:hypothetical protein